MNTPVKLFLLNFFQFFIVVANTRAYTQGQYLYTAITDLVYCIMAFTVTKAIAESKTNWDRVGYALGGMLGAQLSIYITKMLYGA
jgi:TPP-dependent 2-oxoacid decarboxylase